MPELVLDLVDLPLGSHCVSFHVGRDEGARNAASFLRGAPSHHAASYWVADEREQAHYQSVVAASAPQHVGCVAVLPDSQVEEVDGRLRPVAEVRSFVRSHPKGVTAAGETLDRRLTRATVPEQMEYEAWFDSQPRDGSRFLCPYDLRRIPPEDAPEVLRQLGRRHSHVRLSGSQDPAVRLLLLFVFGRTSEVPGPLRPTLDWALNDGFVSARPPDGDLFLTRKGEESIRRWREVGVIDW